MPYKIKNVYRLTSLGLLLFAVTNGAYADATKPFPQDQEEVIKGIPLLSPSALKNAPKPPLPLTPPEQEEARGYLIKAKKLMTSTRVDLRIITQRFSALKEPKKGILGVFQKTYKKKYENTQGDIKAFEEWVKIETATLNKNLKPFREKQGRFIKKDLITIKTLVDGYKKDSVAFANGLQNKIVWTNGNEKAKVFPPFKNYQQLKKFFQAILKN